MQIVNPLHRTHGRYQNGLAVALPFEQRPLVIPGPCRQCQDSFRQCVSRQRINWADSDCLDCSKPTFDAVLTQEPVQQQVGCLASSLLWDGREPWVEDADIGLLALCVQRESDAHQRKVQFRPVEFQA